MYCPTCGNEVSPDGSHCGSCGTPLAGGAQAAQPQMPPVSAQAAQAPPQRRSSAKGILIAVAVALVLAGAGAAYWWFGPRADAARAEEARVAQLETAVDFYEALIFAQDGEALLDTLPDYIDNLGDEDLSRLTGLFATWEVESRDEKPGEEIALHFTEPEENVIEGVEPADGTSTFTLAESDSARGVVEMENTFGENAEIAVVRSGDRWVVESFTATIESEDGETEVVLDFVFANPDKDDSEILDDLRAAIAAEEGGSGVVELVPGRGTTPLLTDDQLQQGSLPEGHPSIPGEDAEAVPAPPTPVPPEGFDPATAPRVRAGETPEEYVRRYCELCDNGDFMEAYWMLPTVQQVYYGSADQFAQTLSSYGLEGFTVDPQVQSGDTITVRQSQSAQGMDFPYTWTFVRGSDGGWLVQSRSQGE